MDTSRADTGSSATMSLGIAAQMVGVETHRLQEVDHALLALLARLGELVNDQGLSDDRAHRHPRIQGGVGVLKNDLHVTAEMPEGPLVQRGDFLVVEDDLARRGLNEAQNAAAGGRLAAAGLTHQAQRLPPLNGEG